MEVSVRANQGLIEEWKGDEGMYKALMEIMEPEINKIVGEATEKVRREAEKARREVEKARKETAEQTVRTAIKLLQSGKLTTEEILECVPQLSPAELRKLEEEQVYT